MVQRPIVSIFGFWFQIFKDTRQSVCVDFFECIFLCGFIAICFYPFGVPYAFSHAAETSSLQSLDLRKVYIKATARRQAFVQDFSNPVLCDLLIWGKITLYLIFPTIYDFVSRFRNMIFIRTKKTGSHIRLYRESAAIHRDVCCISGFAGLFGRDLFDNYWHSGGYAACGSGSPITWCDDNNLSHRRSYACENFQPLRIPSVIVNYQY